MRREWKYRPLSVRLNWSVIALLKDATVVWATKRARCLLWRTKTRRVGLVTRSRSVAFCRRANAACKSHSFKSAAESPLKDAKDIPSAAAGRLKLRRSIHFLRHICFLLAGKCVSYIAKANLAHGFVIKAASQGTIYMVCVRYWYPFIKHAF